MAQCWHRRPRPLAVFCAWALALAAPSVHALALGEPELLSALGENLDLRIPVTVGKGESIEPACFTLSRDPAGAVARLESARVSLERSARGTSLRLRTESAVNEPALALGIVASCQGQLAEYHRDYSLLVDPRTVPAPAPGSAATASTLPSPAALSPFPAAIATLVARIGDTLESIADAIFPGNRAAKKSYIDALRASNTPLAALGDRDPIAVDTPIALPDLRTFARSPSPSPTREAAAPDRIAAAPAQPRAVAPRRAPALPRRAPAEPLALEQSLEPRVSRDRPATPAPAPAPSAEPFASKAMAPVRKHPTQGYVLKLSSGEVDLSRSRSIDDRMRAQLRDRQLVLDADDQVAAVLALRDSVRQLESRVAELQLKLAGMPTSFPPMKTAEAPKPATAPLPAVREEPPAAKVEAPAAKVEPPAAKVESPAAKVQPPAAKVELPAAKEPTAVEESARPAVSAPPAALAPAPEAKTPARPTTPPPQVDWLYYGLWFLALLFVAAALLLAWRLARRRREETAYEEEPEDGAAQDDRIVVADEFGEEPVLAQEPPAPAPVAPRRELDSDVELSTRLPGNTEDLRRRYIEERFPEIGKGAIVLDDPASVVKGARLFYEDGALARSVELLHYATERKPEEVRSWLALFEIFRLERLTGEFAELARRFREHHGNGEYWRKVQYFGREIDPGNELYAPPPINSFETIGPSQARRLAAETSFDPVTENWLGMPMDFQNEVLANELRKALMAEARIGEQDLVPNPMPALRNIEMFSVA